MSPFLSPELWMAVAGVVLLCVLFSGRRHRSKGHQKARLARVTGERRPHRIRTESGNLRKRDRSLEGLFAAQLKNLQFTARLTARLETAGMTATPQQIVKRMLVIGVAVALVVAVGFGKSPSIALGAGMLLGLYIPHKQIARRIRKRQKQFLGAFPEAIELMVRGVRAGLPVAESFLTVSREMPPPLGDTFAQVSQQLGLGVPMDKALAATAKQLGLTEFDFFVTSVILQRETGGNLSEILSNLADMLRQRQMMKLKIKALASEARASAYIVGALPFLVFGALQIMSPEYTAPLFNDYRGNIGLAAALTSMSFGGFIMAKMTQMEI